MKINYKKVAGFIISLSILIIPLFFLNAGELGCDETTINNPLGCKNTSVQALLLKIMNIVAMVGGVVVVFFIIYSGYKFVTASGDPGKIEEAKKTFYATVIGGAILLGADVIANIVVGTINSVRK